MNALQRDVGVAMNQDAVAFECWLNGELRALYAEVLDEPVPDELVALILA